MLVLSIWASDRATAAAYSNCAGAPVSERMFHFEGDSDEVPCDSDSDTPHHHGVCHAHCMAVPIQAVSLENVGRSAQQPLAKRTTSMASGLADEQLRPPIA